MSLNKRIRAYLIAFILISSSLSFLVIVPVNVKAQDGGLETLYFTTYNLTELGYMESFPGMSLTKPTGTNDSAFPPSFSNTEEWFAWFETWITPKLLESDPETEAAANDSGMTVPQYIAWLEEEGYIPNPLEMKEIYTYTGEDNLPVTGSATFDLYFSSNLPSRLLRKDQVKVTISVNDIEINNTTATIEPKLFRGKIQEQTISLDNLDFTLAKGDEIEFSIEMLPSEKLIGNFIGNQDEARILEIAGTLANVLNKSSSSKLQQVGQSIQEFIDATQSENASILTLSDLADLADTVRSSSFIFDSVDHESSVTLPVTLPGEENTPTYYLKADNTLTEEVPTNKNVTKANLKSPQTWTAPSLGISKILTGATASLYIQNRNLIRLLNLGKTNVTFTLSVDGQNFSSTSIELKKTTILSILRPVKPTEITFTFDPREITYDKAVSLEISSDSNFHLLGFRRMASVLYDSSKYPSSLTLQFQDTDNIKMSVDSAADQKIVVGGSAEYILNISSIHEDTVNLKVLPNTPADWNLDYPESVDVSPDNYTLVPVFANYTGTTYGDNIDMTITVTGKTGIASQTLSATVSMDAVQYDVIITAPPGKEIKNGDSVTYTFTIKNNNTGQISDNYGIDAVSEHGWQADVDYTNLASDALQEYNINVIVYVPKDTDVSSDVLTLTVKSTKSGKETSVEVTTTVILPNLLENIYNFFESSAKGLGLDTVLGDYAAPFLIFIILFIILIFVIIIIYLLRRKYVELICLDRIKEIEPEEKAEFDINIHNPYKNKLTYKISAEMDPKSEGWEASVDTEDMVLESKESKPVKLTVKPNDYVKTEGWVEVKVAAENIEKRKVAKISTVTSIKHAEPELRVSGVFHWPKVFKKGDKVITSFRVHNDGKASASNVSITLFVNGEEKNKVENITIPRGGYAEIEMPWIAVKGKNEVNIVVK